jgi:hypothetical protein
MKTHRLPFPLIALVAITVSLVGCSKKSEPAPAPAAPAPAPASVQPDPAKAIADAAQAKIDAAQREAEAVKAQAEAAAAAAKAKASELQAQADQKVAEAQRAAADLKAQATSAKNSFLSSATALKSEATTANAAPVSDSPLPTLTQNLNPANFSAWYEQASKESSGIIASLATKAAELGSQSSPEFKSLYETALAQKQTFDEVSTQLKTGGITQWAALYPKLQTSWTDLSKSLTEAKTLLARFSK